MMQKQNIIQKACLAALLGSSYMVTSAQTQPNDTTVNRTVVVEQQYNPTITDAAKINVVPAIPTLQAEKKTVNYVLTAQPATNIQAKAMQAITGEIPRKKGLPWDIDMNHEWRKDFHRSRIAADWQHAFQRLNLNVGARFDLSNFKTPFQYDEEGLKWIANSREEKQKFAAGGFYVGLQSHEEDRPVWFQAKTSFQLFERKIDAGFQHAKEGMLHTHGTVSAAINDEQRIALALQMDNIFFQKATLKNYTTLDLHPYFTWKTDDWRLHIGAHVNPTFGFGKKFQAAPDVQAQYTAGDNYVVYAQATGGKLLNDFRRLQEVSPYSLINTQVDATYEQINAALGVKGSPLAGWWFHIYGGYQNLKNDLIEGPTFSNLNTSNIYGGLETRYSYKKLLTIRLQGTYRNWDADLQEALCFKPALDIQAEASYSPLTSLWVSLGYQHITREKVAGQKLDDVCNLYTQANYDILRHLGVFARIYNLLGQDYQYQWGWTTKGIGIQGGIKLRF